MAEKQKIKRPSCEIFIKNDLKTIPLTDIEKEELKKRIELAIKQIKKQ